MRQEQKHERAEREHYEAEAAGLLERPDTLAALDTLAERIYEAAGDDYDIGKLSLAIGRELEKRATERFGRAK